MRDPIWIRFVPARRPSIVAAGFFLVLVAACEHCEPCETTGTCPNTSPEVEISEPENGDTLVVSTSVTFSGSATDEEDGQLSGSALVWTSSRDGGLGTGTSFTRDDLSAGNHTIVLSAMDSDGATASSSVTISIEMEETPAFAGWSTVDAGRNHACGLGRDGRVYCWGWKPLSGTGPAEANTYLETAARVVGDRTYTAISVAARHSCAIASSGELYCWGFNAYGQIGTGGTTDAAVPNLVPRPEGVDAWEAVATGTHFVPNLQRGHTCAIATGDAPGLYCWGDNSVAQFGVPPDVLSGSPTPAPIFGGIARVRSGGGHSCVFSSGDVYCFGRNDFGQLGLGFTSAYTSVPENIAEVRVGSFTDVSLGDRHSCGLGGGQIYCWGAGLPLGQPLNLLSPEAIPGTNGATRVAADHDNTCMLDAGGRAWCWGHNDYGAVGNGRVERQRYSTPQEVVGGLTFDNITIGLDFVCGVASGGTAYCWGNNLNGYLGSGETSVSEPAPTRVADPQ